MPRHFPDWLSAFMEYCQHTEAPPYMHFWTGVSTIAGALRRKVWIDQAYFKWYPNCYVVFVAPPGVVAKSTTSGLGMELLKKVPGVKFGPDIVTWPALIEAFEESAEGFEYNGAFLTMSPLTLEASEFGNLLDPKDKAMVDLLVSLWDGKEGSFSKKTKHVGNNTVENPWINLIACTTPSWIAGNFPEYMIGGGFTSRCLFVFADRKHKHVAYPGKQVPKDLELYKSRLVEDLVDISTNLCGEYRLSRAAEEWGERWYSNHYSKRPINLDDDRFGGYIARKQTHIHKLAMILAAASGNCMEISDEQLSTANTMVTDLEPDLCKVFDKIGRTDASFHTDKLINLVSRAGSIKYVDAYKAVHGYFPSMRDFEDVLSGCIKAGFFRLTQQGRDACLEWTGPAAEVAIAKAKEGLIV